MINQEFVRALVFSAPLVGGLVCLTLTILNTTRAKHPVLRKIHYQSITTNGIIVLVWLGFVLHSISHAGFIHYIPLFIPLVMFCYILIYMMVYTITDSGEKPRKFPRTHFIAPGLMSAVMLVTALTVTSEKINDIVYHPDGNAIKYIVVGVCFIYNSIIYRILGLLRIWKYRRTRSKIATDNHHKALGKMLWLMCVDIIVLPLPACGLLLGMDIFAPFDFLWIFAVLPSIVINITACYSLLSENYIALEADPPRPDKRRNEEDNIMRLTRERVENYLEKKKPWLNPTFRITDMAEDLYTNRAYISAFINKEYGMNFNRFINSHRLREVERLRGEAAQKKIRVSSMQLIMNSGFNNYRSYMRAKGEANSSD